MGSGVKGRLRFLLWRGAVWMGWRCVEAGFVLTMAATLGAFMGDRHWAMDLVANGRPQLFVAAMVAAMMFGWAGRRTATAMAGVFALLNLAAMGSYFGTTVEPKVEGQPVFRLMSANVYQLSGPTRDYAMIEPILNDQPWDLVGFQEAAAFWQSIIPNWKGKYPQQSLDVPAAFHHELAFLGAVSPKWRKVEAVPLLQNDLWSRGLALEMEWQGKTVSILMAHAYRPSSTSKLTIITEWHQGIIKWVKEKKAAGHAVIVMGDFNCTPWTAIYRNFAKELGLQETGRGHLFSATWMPEWPHRMLIDHVFVSDEWRVVSWKVGPDFDSDHRPVMVELQWR